MVIQMKSKMAMMTLILSALNLLVAVNCDSKWCGENSNKRCCYNYEEVNKTCIQCKTGYTSKRGEPCHPCKDNTYGFKCLTPCVCSHYQRCDPVVGCVSRDQNTITAITLSVKTVSDASDKTLQKIRPTSHKLSSGITSTIAFLEETTSRYKWEVSTTKEETILVQSETNSWLMYTLCVAGFIVLIGLSHAFRTYRQKTSRSQRLETMINEEQVNNSEVHENNIYHEIDETELLESPATSESASYIEPNPNNDTKPEISNSQHLEDKSDTDDDYLQPYHSNGELSDEKNSDDSSESNSKLSDKSGYINPYQPLESNWQKASHSYEVPVVVHMQNRSSCDENLEIVREVAHSISESDSQSLNQSINYPHQECQDHTKEESSSPENMSKSTHGPHQECQNHTKEESSSCESMSKSTHGRHQECQNHTKEESSSCESMSKSTHGPHQECQNHTKEESSSCESINKSTHRPHKE